jgi:maltooligosyltrehalose trehalohydrolase
MPPLLFMGEEWDAATPFPFFCDFPEPLASAVRKGRRQEFEAAYTAFGEAIPDPLAQETFRSAVLDWDSRAAPAGQRRLGLVRDLLLVRQRAIVPYLAAARFGAADRDGGALRAYWSLGENRSLTLLANLSNVRAPRPTPLQSGQRIWGGEPAGILAPWSVFWSIGAG